MDPIDVSRDIRVLAGSGHRADAARLLLESCRTSQLSCTDAQDLIPDIWLRLDPPAGPLGPLAPAEWTEVFGFAGFFVQGPPTTVATEPIELYRAAPPDRNQGMSWCTHRRMAERFLPKHDNWGRFTIWKARVVPEAILAVLFRPDDSLFDLPIGSAREVVVNPSFFGRAITVVEAR